jgi:excisionase family DNA binding protein
MTTETTNLTSQTMFPMAYSIANFGRFFSIGRSTIYEEIRSGRLKIHKAGARTLISHDDAIAWLNALPTREGQSRHA